MLVSHLAGSKLLRRNTKSDSSAAVCLVTLHSPQHILTLGCFKGSHSNSDSSVPSDVSVPSSSASESNTMTNSNEKAEGWAHLSDSEYGRKRRELLELARSLNELEYVSCSTCVVFRR